MSKLDKIFEFNIASYRKWETFIRPCSHPPLDLPKYFEHNCIFVNDILYQNAMFGQGGKAVKKPQNR